MSLQKTEAIVLKSQKLGETSKIITLYTRKYGKLKVVAKGARGLKSHFYGSLETINYISIVYYFKETRELQLLTQADILESYDNIKKSLEKLSLALVVAEIVLRSQYANESNLRLFKLILEFLRHLNMASSRLENYFYWFLLRFLEFNGFKPKLNSCLVCKQKRTNYRFSLISGGIICASCISPEAPGIPITTDTVTYLNMLAISNVADLEKIENSRLLINESYNLLNKFMAYHIEGLDNLKSTEFLVHLK